MEITRGFQVEANSLAVEKSMYLALTTHLDNDPRFSKERRRKLLQGMASVNQTVGAWAHRNGIPEEPIQAWRNVVVERVSRVVRTFQRYVADELTSGGYLVTRSTDMIPEQFLDWYRDHATEDGQQISQNTVDLDTQLSGTISLNKIDLNPSVIIELLEALEVARNSEFKTLDDLRTVFGKQISGNEFERTLTGKICTVTLRYKKDGTNAASWGITIDMTMTSSNSQQRQWQQLRTDRAAMFYAIGLTGISEDGQ